MPKFTPYRLEPDSIDDLLEKDVLEGPFSHNIENWDPDPHQWLQHRIGSDPARRNNYHAFNVAGSIDWKYEKSSIMFDFYKIKHMKIIRDVLWITEEMEDDMENLGPIAENLIENGLVIPYDFKIFSSIFVMAPLQKKASKFASRRGIQILYDRGSGRKAGDGYMPKRRYGFGMLNPQIFHSEGADYYAFREEKKLQEGAL